MSHYDSYYEEQDRMQKEHLLKSLNNLIGEMDLHELKDVNELVQRRDKYLLILEPWRE